MLRYILHDLEIFADDGTPLESARKDLLWILEGLVQRNQGYLAAHPDTPKLYQSGVRYSVPGQFDDGASPQVRIIREALDKYGISDPQVDAAVEEIRQMIGGEVFRDIPRLYARGHGDCDNIASARIAELRQVGIKAAPRLTWRRRADGGMTYHNLVLWPDGTEEDPSLILGMGGEAKAAERAEELRKNAERRQNFRAAARREAISRGFLKGVESVLGEFARGGDADERFRNRDLAHRGEQVRGGGGGGHHHHHHGGGGGWGWGPGWPYGYGIDWGPSGGDGGVIIIDDYAMDEGHFEIYDPAFKQLGIEPYTKSH